MPIPPFVAELRRHIGSTRLWLVGATAVVLREADAASDGAPGSPDDVHVLLVRRADNGKWTPICGIVDPGEHPAEAAVREAREEACVDIEIESLVRVSVTDVVTYENGDETQYVDLTFRCTWRAGEAGVGDEESSDVRWWPVGALPGMDADYVRRIAAAIENPVSTILN